jgi:ubiquinone/menaquinone biosynthesis C-methylase UbiE
MGIVVAVAGVVAIALMWRWLSLHRPLPCPSWLASAIYQPGLARLYRVPTTLERIGVQPGQRVLEIGPGPGRLLIPIARHIGPMGEAVGLDIQPAMIDRLRANATVAGVSNLSAVVGDAATMSLPGDFDTVYLAMALGEIPDRDGTLQRCFRALKPGGVLSITEMLPDPHFVTQRTVCHLAEQVGFRHQRTIGSWLSFTANFEKPRGS